MNLPNDDALPSSELRLDSSLIVSAQICRALCLGLVSLSGLLAVRF